MEADSTTLDNSSKDSVDELKLPFSCLPRNLLLYKELTYNTGEKSLESQIVERLQTFGLLPKTVKCPTGNPDCEVVIKSARVVDRVQWVCEGCGKRLPIRSGSFFLRILCSLQQTLQIILAWCEDADFEVAAQYCGIKPKVASMIYEKLDELSLKKQDNQKLGGSNAVVLTEMYPDCLTRLSPDTTDQPHVHRILMMADTKHVPTRYHLHVIREDLKKNSANTEGLQKEIEQVIHQKTEADSLVVTGTNVPVVEGAATVQHLVQYCDTDMQHFLTSRIWRQALTLCSASRELCSGAGVATFSCANALQRYLTAALHRLPHGDGFYRHTLTLIADEFTEKLNPSPGMQTVTGCSDNGKEPVTG